MRTLVCGGRNFRDFDFLVYSLHSLDPKPSLIITGSQRSITSKLGIFFGADHFAEEWAKINAIPYIGVPARWNDFGSAAGGIRNALMMEDWRPERVVAFPGNNGTKNMIAVARAAGIEPVFFGW